MLKAGGACNYRRIEWINIQMMVHHFVCAMYTCWRFVTFCGFDTLTFWYSWEIIRTRSVREVGRMMACREVGRQIISDSGLDYLRDWRKDARSRGELPAAGSLTVFGLIWLLALGKPPTHKPSARSSGVPWQFVCLGHQGLPHVSIWWWFQRNSQIISLFHHCFRIRLTKTSYTRQFWSKRLKVGENAEKCSNFDQKKHQKTKHQKGILKTNIQWVSNALVRCSSFLATRIGAKYIA